MRKRHGFAQGFTLIELIVVLAILSLAAAVTLPALLRPRSGTTPVQTVIESARDAAARRGETVYLRIDPSGTWRMEGGGSPLESDGAAGRIAPIATAPLTILVDNNPCSVALAQAAIGSNSATTNCGFLGYNPATESTDQLAIAYAAGQPEGYATWSFSLTKAGTTVYSTGGTVPGPAAPFEEPVATALGGCTVAAFAAYVYVAATANTGWGRCSQYDRSALEAFALAPLT